MSRIPQRGLITTLRWQIANDHSALTDELILGEDNSDPIKVHPELHCVSSLQPGIRGRNFSKNFGRELELCTVVVIVWDNGVVQWVGHLTQIRKIQVSQPSYADHPLTQLPAPTAPMSLSIRRSIN